MPADQIGRVRLAAPESHTPPWERHGLDKLGPHRLVPIHRQRGRIVDGVQVSHPAGKVTRGESRRRQRDRFSQVITELRRCSRHRPASVAVSNQSRERGGGCRRDLCWN
jgi:hypothetical protein